MWLLHEEKDFIQYIHIYFVLKIKYLMNYDSGKKTTLFFLKKCNKKYFHKSWNWDRKSSFFLSLHYNIDLPTDVNDNVRFMYDKKCILPTQVLNIRVQWPFIIPFINVILKFHKWRDKPIYCQHNLSHSIYYLFI